MNSDCAWCGTGEGICNEHLETLFAESKVLAATGQYLARDSREQGTPAQAEPGESKAEQQAAA